LILLRGREISKIELDILSPIPPTLRLKPYGRDEGEEAFEEMPARITWMSLSPTPIGWFYEV
jgi:hypothetical protein